MIISKNATRPPHCEGGLVCAKRRKKDSIIISAPHRNTLDPWATGGLFFVQQDARGGKYVGKLKRDYRPKICNPLICLAPHSGRTSTPTCRAFKKGNGYHYHSPSPGDGGVLVSRFAIILKVYRCRN